MVSDIKKIIVVLFLSAGSFFAQEEKEFHYKGLVNTMGTIAPGFRISDGTMTMSLHGYLEYFMEDYVSWRGDGFYYMGEQKKPASIYQNSTVKWGAFYHFHEPQSKLDFYVGMQPGLSFIQPMEKRDNKTYFYPYKVAPAFSGVTGLNFHFGKFFNMFIEGTYIGTRYLGDGLTKVDASEFRISGGLGWHIVNKKECDCNK
jgi:hypothetical protein